VMGVSFSSVRVESMWSPAFVLLWTQLSQA
jgi:hypothetical protein